MHRLSSRFLLLNVRENQFKRKKKKDLSLQAKPVWNHFSTSRRRRRQKPEDRFIPPVGRDLVVVAV